MLSRLNKRELAAYILLQYRGPLVELGEAVDVLSRELCMTRRTARAVIKRLRKNGLLTYIKRDNMILLEVKPLDQAARELLENYRRQRQDRCEALAGRPGGRQPG
ncbi:MAG: hypothetical protein LRS48_01065 [Desulfurococcales archaeon]|nr:hypothetical protein [Desulfurococcales archaeon]